MRDRVIVDKSKKRRVYRSRQCKACIISAVMLILISMFCTVVSAKSIYETDSGYRMQKTALMIKTGSDHTVKIFNNGTKVNPEEFKWSSNNLKCVKAVNGKIYGLKPGTAVVTAQKGILKLSCEVFVYNKTETVLFKKYKKQTKIKAGKTIFLQPKKCGKKISYTSSDKTVATVSKKGKVTAKKPGSAKITCISYGINRYISEIEIIVIPTQPENSGPEPSVTPEVTPTPETTPTPEVTPTPEITPTPEVTPAPEIIKDFQKPLDGVTRYILHRGDQTAAPENSMPAFEAAGRSGAEFVETDVRETGDGVLVVSHDDSLQRMCGEDRLISEMTYDEIRQYPIINGSNASQYPDNLIPSLEEYIACCNRYSMTPVLEIKSIRTEEGMASFMKLLSQSKKDPVVICFRIETLSKLRELGFGGRLQWIRTVRMTASMIQHCKKYNLDICSEYKNISMNDISNAHQNGLRISIWLCRDKDMTDIFRKMGADYIIYEKWLTDCENDFSNTI